MTVYQRSVQLMEADLGDELVALDVARGQCFGFNSVANSVWKLLAEPRSFDDLRSRLMEEYDVGEQECSEELRTLLTDLTEKGLISQG